MNGGRCSTTRIWRPPSSTASWSADGSFASMDPRDELVISSWRTPCQAVPNGSEYLEYVAQNFRNPQLFVMTLGYSRKSVRLLVFRSSSRTWAELHERAFRRLGGSPRIVVLDNLREGVLTPDLYDPILNPLFKDVLAHYGVTAMPCRIKD